MGFLDFYKESKKGSDISSISKIVDTIKLIEPEKADKMAMMAFLLARVAYADLDVSKQEQQRIIDIIKQKYQFSDTTAQLVMELAVTQNKNEGATDNYLVTREFKNSSTESERHICLKFLFEVACADADISAQEDSELKLIAHELGILDTDFVLIRREFSEYRLGRSKSN